MTILITGSNGLLGQKLIYALLKINKGEQPVGKYVFPKTEPITIIATSAGENRLLEKNGYTYTTLDITDKIQVEKAVKQFTPDVIINTAAMTNVDACETEKEKCWSANVIAVKNIVDTLNEIKSASYNPQLIHISTDFIFDGEAGPYTEEGVANPLSYYALSKWEGEKIVQASALHWSILRTIIVYGVIDNASRSNLVLWAKSSLSAGKQINVVDDQFRSPTLAEDLAQGCILAALKGAKGIYNISGEKTYSILDLVYKVADYWKLDKSLITPIKSATLNQPAKRPPNTGFIIDKAKRELGYNPFSFEEGLAIVDEQLKK